MCPVRLAITIAAVPAWQVSGQVVVHLSLVMLRPSLRAFHDAYCDPKRVFSLRLSTSEYMPAISR